MKINYNNLDNKSILYILQIDLEDKQLVKIGITNKNIEERVCQILTSIWKRYRIFPKCYVKRYKTVSNYKSKELEMLEYFKKYSYEPKYKFSGHTEVFDVDLDLVVDKYEDLIK